MISFFRRLLSSWIVLALLGLVIVAFIVTGIGDPFGGGPPATTVAEIDNREIADGELANQFDRQLQQIRQEQPGITAAQAIGGGALEGVLERLLGSRALMIMADRLGLGASKRQVDAEIASVPAFRGPDGRFSEDTFRSVIAAQGLSEPAIREEIGGDVVRRQLLALVDTPSATPRTIAEPYVALQLERRTINFGAVPAQVFSVPAPTDADAEAFYRRNIAQFTVPERRRISYALIDRAAIAAGVVVTDAAFADYYKRNAKQFAASERRALRQVVLPDRAAADAFARRVAGGEDFAKVAVDAGFSGDDTSLGTLGKAELATTISGGVADVAFAAAAGTVTQPVQSDFGWHIVRVDRIETQPARALADVRDEIRPAVARELVEDRVADVIEKADDLLADGANLGEAAKDLGLAVVKLPPVTSQGLTLGEAPVQLEERVRPVIERAFAHEVDEELTVEDISPELHAIIDVEAVVPPTPLPLADVKAQVLAGLRFERQMAAAKTAADAIAAGVKAGRPIATLLAERKLPPPQSITARRIELGARRQQVPAPVALGFALAQGEVRTIAQPQSGAWFVVEVARVEPGNAAEAPALVDSMRSQLREAATGELAQGFVGAIMADLDVKRYPQAISRLKQRYTGSGDAAQ
jgi:parvulin-like peptidyl-prolyl isomerase